MGWFEEIAVEHPRVRRLILLAGCAVLLAFVTVSVASADDVGKASLSVILAAISGVLGAIASFTLDSALLRRWPERSVRWGARGGMIAAAAGAIAAVAWQPNGPVTLLAAFLLGFFAVGTFRYPIRPTKRMSAHRP